MAPHPRLPISAYEIVFDLSAILVTGRDPAEPVWRELAALRTQAGDRYGQNTEHIYDRSRHYIVAVKVIDIFGNDTMILVSVNVG